MSLLGHNPKVCVCVCVCVCGLLIDYFLKLELADQFFLCRILEIYFLILF
jgi:hypothetical protein